MKSAVFTVLVVLVVLVASVASAGCVTSAHYGRTVTVETPDTAITSPELSVKTGEHVELGTIPESSKNGRALRAKAPAVTAVPKAEQAGAFVAAATGTAAPAGNWTDVLAPVIAFNHEHFPHNATAAGVPALPVRVAVPGLAEPLYGLLVLYGLPGGANDAGYQIEVPQKFVDATADGRASVVYEQQGDLTAWALFLSRRPFEPAPGEGGNGFAEAAGTFGGAVLVGGLASTAGGFFDTEGFVICGGDCPGRDYGSFWAGLALGIPIGGTLGAFTTANLLDSDPALVTELVGGIGIVGGTLTAATAFLDPKDIGLAPPIVVGSITLISEVAAAGVIMASTPQE